MRYTMHIFLAVLRLFMIGGENRPEESTSEMRIVNSE